MTTPAELPVLVKSKYRITQRIGAGSFGEIYEGIGPNGVKVAVKFEKRDATHPQLRHEYKVYRELENCVGFCRIFTYTEQDNYNIMVMELLGPSLEDLFNRCRRRFSLKTVLKIADQLLDRLDTLHERHLIHRDIKTNNFVIGLGSKANMIYCVDFGMSKRYRDPKTLQHTPFCDWKSLSGTPRYASINNHLGIRPTRRDDLEALAYILIYFLKGSLPWQGLKAKTEKEKYKLILKKKQETSIDALCHGCPAEFAEFVQYTRTLKFDEQPDIPRWRKIFRDLYIRANCDAIPKEWDWDVVEPERSPVSRSGGRPGAMDPPVARPINTMPPPPTANTTVDRMTSRDNTRGPEPMSVGGGDLEEPYPVMDGPFVHPRAPAAAETDRYGVRPPQPPPNNSSAAMSPPNRFGFFPSNDRTRR